MKNLITYLKALWSWVSGSQRKKIGVTLGEATIEHPFSTYSAPFGTCWQPSGKLHSVVRCAAMLVMLLTLGSGNAWASNWTGTSATNAPAGTYKAMTSGEAVVAGDTIIVVHEGDQLAMSTTQNTNNRGTVSITVSSSTVTLNGSTAVQALTVGTSAVSGAWILTTVNGYLYAPSYNSSTSNYLRTETTNKDKAGGDWVIGYNSIVANGNGTRRYIRRNGNLISCYASGAQNEIKVYKKAHTVTYNANGGSTTCSDATLYKSNANVTVCTTEPTRSNYNFTGWTANVDLKNASTSATITAGTLIAAGTTIVMPAKFVVLTAQWEAAGPTPTITVSKTAIAYGDKKMGSTYQETFTVSGSDLTADISLAVGGANPTLFAIDKTSLTQSGGTVSTTTITVTWTPSASYNAATITISSTGATSKTVALSGWGKWEVTWMKNGDEYETTLVASGQRPTFPESAPTSCDTGEGASTTFYGWATEEWTGKIDNLTGKTVYVSNGEMPTVSANGTIYYAVFAKTSGSEVTDVINNSVTTSHLGSTGTSTWVDVWETSAMTSGAKYKIRSMGINGATNYALQWNGNAYLFCSQAPSTGLKLKSISATVLAAKNLGLYASTSAYTDKATATSLATLSATTSGATYNLTAAQLENNYTCPAVNGTASSTQVVSISITYSSLSYSKYMTNCCNTPTLAFAASPYAVIRQDIQGASTTTWAEVDVTFTSTNTTGTISATTYTSGKTVYSLSTWQSRATTGGSLCATDHAYFEVLTQPSGATPGTGKFHVKTTTGYTGQGTYRIAITQAATDAEHGNYCEATVYGFVDVTLRDKFVDKLNDNGTVNKDGHGAQLATPLLSELGTQVENACHSEGRKLKGWIKETDLKAQYETGNSTRIYTLDGLCETCTDGSDQTSLIVAPGTNVTMSGATWYAVWAYER